MMNGDHSKQAVDSSPEPFFVPHAALHSGYSSRIMRQWQCQGVDKIGADNLMWPVFLIDDADAKEEVPSLPGVFRMGTNVLLEAVDKLVPMGLKSVLLFSVTNLPKDEIGSGAMAPENPVFDAIRQLKAKHGDGLLVACDVCICPYTSHGHCGIFRKNPDTGKSTDVIDNPASIEQLAKIAGSYASAGADIVAPSDMMDGRIGAIKKELKRLHLDNKVSVLSYSVKFASSFYGPFRDAAKSAPAFGDRRSYQLPPASKGLALRAADRDVSEGADMLMVKPGIAYLDMVSQVKDRHPGHPMFIYQVSGEYAMLVHGANAGAIDLQAGVMESLACMRRAGVDVVITYFTPKILEWIEEKGAKGIDACS